VEIRCIDGPAEALLDVRPAVFLLGFTKTNPFFLNREGRAEDSVELETVEAELAWAEANVAESSRAGLPGTARGQTATGGSGSPRVRSARGVVDVVENSMVLR